jgi:hypothetical protein
LLAESERALLPLVSRFSFGLVPLGFAMWIAHYGFHFFTGALTLVPVVQGFALDLGVDVLGTPRRDLAAILPRSVIDLIELVVLQLGLLVTLAACYLIGVDTFGKAKAVRGTLPWAVLALLIFGAANWLMAQPMEMRGTFLN